ncbi:MAG: hypothetical protein NT102_00565 [Caldiserica bacterium]|nr:hypothetical protein [Caldisericota bacterium]
MSDPIRECCFIVPDADAAPRDPHRRIQVAVGRARPRAPPTSAHSWACGSSRGHTDLRGQPLTPTLSGTFAGSFMDPTPPKGSELPVAFMTSFDAGCTGVAFPLCDSILDHRFAQVVSPQ